MRKSVLITGAIKAATTISNVSVKKLLWMISSLKGPVSFFFLLAGRELKNEYDLKISALAGFILYLLSITTSLLLCAMELRFCFLLYKFIRHEQR